MKVSVREAWFRNALLCFEDQGDTASEDKAHYFNCLCKYNSFQYSSEVYVSKHLHLFVVQ